MGYTRREILALIYLFRNGGFAKALSILRLGLNPIIIGGCGRSGTTLLLSMLSCHPHIYAVNMETRAFCPDGYAQNPDLDSPLKLKKFYGYLLKNAIPAECTRWCEKTPRNVLYYERILRYFGRRVRIINIVRDGRDVITSRHPSGPHKFWVTPERWVIDVTAGKQLDSHPQVKTIRYEDLLNNHEETIKSVCRFIDESFVEDFLSYPNSTAVQLNAAWFGKAKPLSTSSIGRWKNVEYKERVATLLSNSRALELLEYYGYDYSG